MKPLLTIKEVSKILGVKEPTVYRMLDRGDIPKTQVGRSVRVHPDDLQKKINEWRGLGEG